jgi:hypothetical protein
MERVGGGRFAPLEKRELKCSGHRPQTEFLSQKQQLGVGQKLKYEIRDSKPHEF